MPILRRFLLFFDTIERRVVAFITDDSANSKVQRQMPEGQERFTASG